MPLLIDFLATQFTSPTQRTKTKGFSVSGLPTTPEPRYLILSTSPVLTMGNTSFTTTTGIIVLLGIQLMPTMNSTNWKYMVLTIEIDMDKVCVLKQILHITTRLPLFVKCSFSTFTAKFRSPFN